MSTCAYSLGHVAGCDILPDPAVKQMVQSNNLADPGPPTCAVIRADADNGEVG